MPKSRTHVFGLVLKPFLADPTSLDPRLLLVLSAVHNNEVLPLLDTPVGVRMLSKHNGKYCNTLHDWMDVAFSFPKAYYILLGTLGVSLDLFLQGEDTESSNSNILPKLLDNNIICLQ